MKKLVSFLVVIITIVLLSSCSRIPNLENSGNNNNNNTNDNGFTPNVTIKSNYENLESVVSTKVVSFTANQKDNEGRIVANPAEHDESLEIIVEGYTKKLVSSDRDIIKVNLDLSKQVSYSSDMILLLEQNGINFDTPLTTYNVLKSLIDSNYITYPIIKYWNYDTNSWNNEREYDLLSQFNVQIFNNEEIKCGQFKFSIKFNWGSKFGFMNPCYYYDTHLVGINVPNDKVIEEFNEFTSLLWGLTREEYAIIRDTNYSASLSYIIFISE